MGGRASWRCSFFPFLSGTEPSFCSVSPYWAPSPRFHNFRMSDAARLNVVFTICVSYFISFRQSKLFFLVTAITLLTFSLFLHFWFCFALTSYFHWFWGLIVLLLWRAALSEHFCSHSSVCCQLTFSDAKTFSVWTQCVMACAFERMVWSDYVS